MLRTEFIRAKLDGECRERTILDGTPRQFLLITKDIHRLDLCGLAAVLQRQPFDFLSLCIWSSEATVFESRLRIPAIVESDDGHRSRLLNQARLRQERVLDQNAKSVRLARAHIPEQHQTLRLCQRDA